MISGVGISMAAGAATYVYKCMKRMPAPYDDRVAEDIPPERLALYTGFEKGSPFPADLTGVFAPNDRLKAARRLFVGAVDGSESVAVTPSGELIMLDKFGYLHRGRAVKGGDRLAFELIRDSADPPIYMGPGRPLGFHVVEGGRALLICDSLKGLVRVPLPGAGGGFGGGGRGAGMEVLASSVVKTGEPLNYANDLDVAEDGTVYFTTSTKGVVGRNSEGFYDTMRSYMFNLLAGDASGKLLVWSPETHEAVPLIENMHFANGVAISEDGSFVVAVETHLSRVMRYWLQGPKKGTHEVFVDRLPGYPDGICRDSAGGFWVTLICPLSPVMKIAGPRRWLRQLLSHAIMALAPFVAKRWGCVVRLDGNGTPVECLMDPKGEVVSSVSAVTEANGLLFCGNLGGSGVSVLDLTAQTPAESEGLNRGLLQA